MLKTRFSLYGMAMLLITVTAACPASAQQPVFTPGNRDTTVKKPVTSSASGSEKEQREKEELLKSQGVKDGSQSGQKDKNTKGNKDKLPVSPGDNHTAPAPPYINLPSGTPAFVRDSLDSYIERGMRDWQIPGLALAIVKDGKVIFSKGYGVRELGKPEKVDENTLFIIASNSKLFTGTSLAKLDAEHRLSLNDKITRYIPWFRLYNNDATDMATVRDMLCHRIGTKTFQGDFTFWDSNLPKDSIIWKMRYLNPPGLFRQDYGYCNSCFLVAGQVLEKVTGQSWESYVKANILDPLGMSNTYMSTAGLVNRDNTAFPHNNLYSPLTRIPFDQVDNLGPATSMVSNVKDLSKWLMLQLDSGKYNGQQVIPWGVLQKTRDMNIFTSSRKNSLFPMHFRGYGLGVFATDYSGKQVYWHTGGAFGMVTNVCFVPEAGLGITILTNNDNQSFFEALRYQLLDAYLGVPYENRSLELMRFFLAGKEETDKGLAAMDARVKKKNSPEFSLDAYTGEFSNTIYGKVKIRKSNNMLVCHFEHHPDLIGYMEYMDNNEFRITYSNIGYGIYPVKYTVENGKVKAVDIKSNEFVESDSYLFTKISD